MGLDKIKAQEALTQRLLEKSKMLKQSKSCERFRGPSASKSKMETRDGLESEVREYHQED